MNKRFFAKKRVKVIIGLVLFLLAAGLVLGKTLGSGSGQEYVTAKAEKKDLAQTVGEVGVVKSKESVELGFQSAGKLANKFVEVGTDVKVGYLLAELDHESLLIQRQQAESNLASAEASLKKLLAGATASDIAVVESQVSEAQKAYDAAAGNLEKTKKTVAEEIRQAERNLNDLLSSSLSDRTTYEQNVLSSQTALSNTKASFQRSIDNSVDNLLTDVSAKLAVANTALDNVDTIIGNDDLKDYLSSKDKSYLERTKTEYSEAEVLAVAANNSLYGALQDKKTESTVKRSASDALAYLNKTAETLNDCYSALEASTISASLLTTYKTNISAQISYVSAAIAAIQADKQSLDGAYLAYQTNVSAAENNLKAAEVALENATTAARNALATVKVNGDQRIAAAEASVRTSREGVEVAKNQLSKLKSPARSEDVSLAQAQVSQAQSSLDLVNKQISDSFLKAPIEGRIVKDNFERGEQVSPGQAVFSLLGKNNYEIDVDISESDIAKLKVGDEAEVTLDAFGDDRVFKAVVDFIEPAETVIQDVVYYKVSLKFSDEAERLSDVKPGMTANVTIITAKRENVLVIPERAISEKSGGEKYVRVLRDGQVVESPVKTGLKGDGGSVEVISGVGAGDEVVVFIKPKK